MLQTIAIAVANHRFFVSMCRTRFKSFRRLVVCSGFPVSTAILVAICIRRVSKRKDHNSPKFDTKTFTDYAPGFIVGVLHILLHILAHLFLYTI